MPVFIDDMINHIENFGKSVVIQLVREFSMVNCYIIKIQKVLWIPINYQHKKYYIKIYHPQKYKVLSNTYITKDTQIKEEMIKCYEKVTNRNTTYLILIKILTFLLKLDNSNLNNTETANGEEEASTPTEVEWLVITNIKIL